MLRRFLLTTNFQAQSSKIHMALLTVAVALRVALLPHLSTAARFTMRSATGANGTSKWGDTVVTILTAAHDGIGGPSAIPIGPTLPKVRFSNIVANTFSFTGGGNNFQATDNCKSSNYWQSTKEFRVTGGFVQISGNDRVRLYNDDGEYRSFHPWWGAYTPSWSKNAQLPEGSQLISDAVLTGEGSNTGLLARSGGQLYHVDSDSGSSTQACNFPALAETDGEVHIASVPGKKVVVAGKNFNGGGRPNELFVLDTSSSGTCSSKSWPLQPGEWFCGMAVDQSSRKAYVLVEHHEGTTMAHNGYPAAEAACGNTSRTVDRLSVYEVPLDNGGSLSGHEVLQLPDFNALARSVYGHDMQSPIKGLPTLFMQQEKIWLLQLSDMVYPIHVTAPQVPEPFACRLVGWDLPPTIWAEAR